MILSLISVWFFWRVRQQYSMMIYISQFSMKKIYLLATFSILLTLSGCNQTASTGNPDTSGKTATTALEQFGECLTKADAVFYGTEWCPHCKDQKTLLGEGLAFANYVDCDKNTAKCSTAGVTGYPTWVIGDGSKKLVGTQPLKSLAEATGCTAPSA